MTGPEGIHAETALAQRAGEVAGRARTLKAFVAMWGEIRDALSPVIGHGGFIALYRRSVTLNGPTYPWLLQTLEEMHAPADLDALSSLFAHQTPANVAAAGAAMLQTFCSLLTSLIGPSLTDQLLGPVWAGSKSGPFAQETE